MTRILVLACVLLAAGAAPAPAQLPAVSVSDPVAHEIASQLRCVVCQNLSVADSPSEMAQQMRAIVRERLAAGDSPEQVIDYFVERYGEWILLAPPRRGFNLLVWTMPLVAVAAGLLTAGVLVRRWARAPARVPAASDRPLDPAVRARIRREMEAEEL